MALDPSAASPSCRRENSGDPKLPQDNETTSDADRARLEALRDHLEAVIRSPDTTPRDLAAVSREYRQTIAALAALAPGVGTSKLDEIAARRRRRGA